MRMPWTSIDLKPCRQPAPQTRLGKHSQDGFAYKFFRLRLQHPLSGNFLQPTRISRVVPVNLLLKLSPGQAYLFGVNNNNTFAMVRKRSPVRRFFPDQNPRGARSKPPQDDPVSINQVPAYSSSFLFLKVRIQFSYFPNFKWVNPPIFTQFRSSCQYSSLVAKTRSCAAFGRFAQYITM